MYNEGLLLLNVFTTDGRGFFWNKYHLVRSLVQFLKILWESSSVFLEFEIQSFLLLPWFAIYIAFFHEDLGWVPRLVGGFHDLMDDCVSLLLISRNYEINVNHYFGVLKLAFKNTVLKCYSNLCRQFIGMNSTGSSGQIPFPDAWWFKCKTFSKTVVINCFC